MGFMEKASVNHVRVRVWSEPIVSLNTGQLASPRSHECEPGPVCGLLHKEGLEELPWPSQTSGFTWVSRSLCLLNYCCCSVTQSCPALFDPMDRSTPGLPVLHHLLELAQTHLYWISDTIQSSHPLLSPSLAFDLSQHQGLFQWAGSLHHVAKVLEHQL